MDGSNLGKITFHVCKGNLMRDGSVWSTLETVMTYTELFIEARSSRMEIPAVPANHCVDANPFQSIYLQQTYWDSLRVQIRSFCWTLDQNNLPELLSCQVVRHFRSHTAASNESQSVCQKQTKANLVLGLPRRWTTEFSLIKDAASVYSANRQRGERV